MDFSRLFARLSLTEIMLTASLDITLPCVDMGFFWLRCCRRDASQTLWPVVSQDPSSWWATVTFLPSSFSGTEATCNGSLPTLGPQFCSFTCEILLNGAWSYWFTDLHLICLVYYFLWNQFRLHYLLWRIAIKNILNLGLSLKSSAGKTGTLNPVNISAVFLSSPSALLHICPQTSWLPAFAI